jgi:hypothetical protein
VIEDALHPDNECWETAHEDVPRLIAEIRRLRLEVETAYDRGYGDGTVDCRA